MRALPIVLAAALPVTAWAQANAVQAAPSGWASLLQVLLSLALVLALIVGAAWLTRRLGGGALGASRHLRVVGGVMVGQKERVVIVEQGGQWLVLGVTAGSVTLLDKQAKPDDAPEAPQAALPESFSRILANTLARARKGGGQ